MPSARSLLTATAALAALAIPATAVAKPHAVHGKAKVHQVSLLLRGTYSGGDLQVKGGNHAARRAGLVGQSVTLDLTSAKLKVGDRNGDGTRDAEDLQDGDKVVVQARVARGEAASGPLTVRKLVARAQSGADQAGDTEGSDDSSSDDPADA